MSFHNDPWYYVYAVIGIVFYILEQVLPRIPVGAQVKAQEFRDAAIRPVTTGGALGGGMFAATGDPVLTGIFALAGVLFGARDRKPAPKKKEKV